MNGKGKGNGKGKSMAQSAASTEKDPFHLPLTHTQASHSSTARYPFMIDVHVVEDAASHWEVGKEIWQEAVTDATRPYMAARPSNREL